MMGERENKGYLVNKVILKSKKSLLLFVILFLVIFVTRACAFNFENEGHFERVNIFS